MLSRQRRGGGSRPKLSEEIAIMEKTQRKIVRAHENQNGIIVFELLKGSDKLRVVRTFGYGTRHGIWLRLHGLGTSMTTMTAEPASLVKEQIAQWKR